jgi:hypothetical protein
MKQWREAEQVLLDRTERLILIRVKPLEQVKGKTRYRFNVQLMNYDNITYEQVIQDLCSGTAVMLNMITTELSKVMNPQEARAELYKVLADCLRKALTAYKEKIG